MHCRDQTRVGLQRGDTRRRVGGGGMEQIHASAPQPPVLTVGGCMSPELPCPLLLSPSDAWDPQELCWGWHCEPGDIRLGVRLRGHRLGQMDAVSKATLRITPWFSIAPTKQDLKINANGEKKIPALHLIASLLFFSPPIPEHQSVFLFLLDFPYSLAVAELLFSFTDFFSTRCHCKGHLIIITKNYRKIESCLNALSCNRLLAWIFLMAVLNGLLFAALHLGQPRSVRTTLGAMGSPAGSPVAGGDAPLCIHRYPKGFCGQFQSWFPRPLLLAVRNKK